MIAAVEIVVAVTSITIFVGELNVVSYSEQVSLPSRIVTKK